MRTFRKDSRVRDLRTLDAFAGLSRNELEAIGQLTTAVTVRAGKPLCVQGREGYEVFGILSGPVTITHDDHVIGIVGAGTLLGEMAVLGRTVRSATAVALTEVSALVMSVREFDALLIEFPNVAERITELAEARRRELLSA